MAKVISMKESINVPDMGSRSFTIDIYIPEDKQVIANEARVIVEALKQFIESGGEVGDAMVGQDWIVEFSLLRETVVRQDESGTEYCKTYLVAVLRSASDESGTECKAVYRIVVDFDKQKIIIQDISGLVGLEQRTDLKDILKEE